jgi:translation initiation factor 2 subunit 3
MPGDETLQKDHNDSGSEDEEDDVEEEIQKVDVDVTKLTPLSPEVISKQVGSKYP